MINYLAFFLLNACLLSPFIDHRLGYIFLGALALIGILNFHKIKWPHCEYSQLLFITPLLVFFSWIYGIFVGLINGNELEFIFSNFLGLAFYPAFYGLLASRLTFRQVVRSIFLAAVIYFAYGFWLLLEVMLSGEFLAGLASSISDFRILYHPAFLYMVPFISLGIFRSHGLFCSRQGSLLRNSLPSWTGNNIFLLGMLIVFLFVPMSKGFFAIIISLLILRVLIFVNNTNILTLLTLLTLLLINLYYLVELPYLDLLINSFSTEESSNSVRSEQFEYLVDEFTFFGAGLGAVLHSGFIRTPEAPYGFELTFINLFHKLGWMCAPLLFSYFLPIFLSLKLLFTKLSYKESFGAFILGLMAFIIPGYGNPLLLASNIVLFHCLGLFLVYQYLERC